MDLCDADTPKPSAGLTPTLSAVRAIAWGETFVLIPMHAFWMLYRSTPFVAENTESALVAAVPLIVLALAGVAALIPRVRGALMRAEWLLHVTAAVGMLLLLVYVTVRDPLSPAIPITWPLCFWSICVSFIVLANVALHERIRAAAGPEARSTGLVGILTAVGAWALLTGLASSLDWAPYFWSASLLFHACMAPHSRRNAAPVLSPFKPFEGGAALLESLFLVSLLLAALLRVLFTATMLGRAELKYVEFVNIAAHPLFAGGVVLALLAGRFRLGFLAHAIVAGIFLFTPETTTWTIGLVLGYTLPALYLASHKEGPLGYALTLPAATAAWAFGMLGFMLCGLVVEMKVGLGFAEFLNGRVRLLTMILYAVWLAAAGAVFWWNKRRAAAPMTEQAASAPALAAALTYAGIWGAICVLVVHFVTSSMWPPVVFHRAERVKVGEPAGVCHAGYSESDEEYTNLHKLGVRMMRIDFHWDRIQKDPDTWDWSRYDGYVDAAEKHGVKVVALLVFDNNAVESNEKGARKGHYLAPEDLPKYLEYVRRTVTRYEGRVYAWELWNEPDMPRFWDGPLDELYELVARAAETVREAAPDATLIGPAATSPLGVHVPGVVEGFHARGLLEQVDHPTMHTYISDPRGYYGEYFRVMNAAAKYGHPGSVWITELGDPDGGLYPWRGSRDHLAVHVMKAYTIATSVGIENLIWYCYRDSDPESLRKKWIDSEGFFGLTNRDGSWKPAAYAYSLFSKNCSNSVIRSDLVEVDGVLAGRQLRTALYRRDTGESALVMWFEPGLRRGAHARVRLDLGQLEQPAIAHGITNGDTKPVFDPVIDVTETPTFITFTADGPDTPVRLRAASAPGDAAWLLLGLILVIASACSAVGLSPRKGTDGVS